MNEEAYWSDCDRIVKITLCESEESPELRELCAFQSWELSSWGNTLSQTAGDAPFYCHRP